MSDPQSGPFGRRVVSTTHIPHDSHSLFPMRVILCKMSLQSTYLIKMVPTCLRSLEKHNANEPADAPPMMRPISEAYASLEIAQVVESTFGQKVPKCLVCCPQLMHDY